MPEEMVVPLHYLYLPWNASPNPFSEILWREWEDFSTQPDAQGLKPGDGPQFQFTLMSYNILAQDLMQQSSELYLHCHPDILNWNYRFMNLMQEFQHWDPDVSEVGSCHLALLLDLGCFPVLLEDEFNPIVVQMIGVLSRVRVCLPSVSELLADAEKNLPRCALSSTFMQEGRLEGFKEQENPVHMSNLFSLGLGLFLLLVTGKFHCDPAASYLASGPAPRGWGSHSSTPE